MILEGTQKGWEGKWYPMWSIFFLVEGRVAPFLHISVLFTSERTFTRLSLSYINSISVYANTTCLANTRDQIEVDW